MCFFLRMMELAEAYPVAPISLAVLFCVVMGVCGYKMLQQGGGAPEATRLGSGVAAGAISLLITALVSHAAVTHLPYFQGSLGPNAEQRYCCDAL